MTVIYIDVLFLENFIVNYLILFTAAYISGERVPRLRLLAGAFLGGVYAAGAFLPEAGEVLSHPLMKLLAGALMCLAAFGGKKHTVKLSLVFFGCACAFAGGVFAVSLLTERDGIYVGTKTLAMALCVMFALCLLIFGRFARHGGIGRDTQLCRMFKEGRKSETVALVDTGNTLCDPISGDSVIVVDREFFLPLLSRETADILRCEKDAYSAFSALGGRELRIMPYSTVSGTAAMLVLRPDRVLLGDREVKNVLLGLSPGRVSDGGGYGALVGDI